MLENVMEELLRSRLRDAGYNIQAITASDTIGKQTAGKVLRVCKDTSGAVGLLNVPQTWLLFDGVICTVDQVMFLIEKNVAREWGILK